MNTAVEPLSRRNIREAADELRKMVGYEKEKYFPVVHFIEWVLANPDNECGLEIEIVPEEVLGDTYGLTNTGKNKMQIREDVYIRAARGNPRDRFTLSHEVGHYFLHQPDRVSYARGEVPVYRNPEWQANVFAAELMAPCSLLQGMTVEEIMNECGISRQAANIQWKEAQKLI